MTVGFKTQWALIKEGFEKGFKYDGCTGVPDFNFGMDCCAEHDYHYRDATMARSEADKRLRQCIQSKGYILLPWIYWLGVRILGRGYYKRKRNEDISNDSSSH